MRIDVSGLTYEEMIAAVSQLQAKAFSIVKKGERIFVEVASPAPALCVLELEGVCFSC